MTFTPADIDAIIATGRKARERGLSKAETERRIAHIVRDAWRHQR